MPLAITLEGTEAAAGGVVRGRVAGCEEWPEAREVRVSLEHRTKHLKGGPGAEVALAAPASGEAEFAIGVPPGAYPTFEGKHFESRWEVEAVVDLPRRRDVTAAAEILVHPPAAPAPAPAPESAAWGGYRIFRRFLAIFTVADLALLAGVWIAVGEVPGPALVALLVPAALSLVALALLVVAGSAIDRLEVALPRRAWRFGEMVPVEVVLEAEPGAVAALEVALKGEEVWTTSSGQATTTHREAFHEEIRRLAGPELRGARLGSRRWQWSVELPLPATGPPSHGKDVRWGVVAKADVPRRPDPTAGIELDVAGRVPREGR